MSAITKSVLAVLMVGCGSVSALAQNTVTTADDIVAPVVARSQPVHHGWKYYVNPKPRNIREYVLWGSYSFDMVGTVTNVTHPEWYNRYDPSYGVMASWKEDFSEGGWARFVGKRNAPGIVAMNFLLDWTIVVLDRRIDTYAESKSRPWKLVKWIADGYVAGQGVTHIDAGIGNYRGIHRIERFMQTKFPGGCWSNTPLAFDIQPSAVPVCH